ncbi:MAG: hypothetical protein PVJ49_16045, partial [Acidobacteriota bacterium]
PTAIVSGRTSAFVRDGVNMVADSLKVQAGKAGGDRVKYEAEARSLTVNVSFGGAAQDLEAFALVGDPDAVDPGEGAVIEAFIGAPDAQTGGTGDPSAKLDINDATEPVVVSALSDIDAVAKTQGGGGALGVTVAFYKPTADANGITRAYAGDGTDMRVTGLKILADGDAKADATLVNIGIAGLATVGGLSPVARTNNVVDAFVGRRKESTQTGQITVDILDGAGTGRGNLDIDAVGRSEANATATSFSFAGGASVNLIRADADLLGSTRAYIGKRVDLTAGTIDILAQEAKAKSNARMDGAAASLVVTVSDIKVESAASRMTEAFVADYSHVDITGHSMTVWAKTDTGEALANAEINSGSGAGLANIALMDAAARVGGVNDNGTPDDPSDDTGQASATRAYVGNNVVIDAVDLKLDADANTSADALVNAPVTIGGIANVTITDVLGTAAHDTEAYVGDNGDLNLSGKLEVTADATTTATPSSNRVGGSFGVDFGDTDIKTLIGSDTSAWIGDGTDVDATTVKLKAEATHNATAKTSSVGIAGILSIASLDAVAKDTGSVNVRIGSTGAGDSNDRTKITTTQTNVDGVGIDVDAKLTSNVVATPSAANFGLVGAAGVKATADSEAAVTGRIGGYADLEAQAGDIDILIDLVGVARGAAMATAAGFAGVTVSTADVDFNANANLTVGSHADLDATSNSGNVNIEARLNHDGTHFLTQDNGSSNGKGAIGSADNVAVGLVGVGVADVVVGANSTMFVEVASNASLSTGGVGNVNVSGLHSNTAFATLSNVAAGIAAVTTGNAKPTALGSTTVNFFGDVPDANNLNVRADASSVAEGTLSSTSGGVVSVNGGNVVSKAGDPSGPTPVNLTLGFGNGSTDINVDTDVTVTATLYTDADSRTTSQSAGLVTVASLNTQAHALGAINLNVGANSNVTAGGTIDITAGHGSPGAQVSDGTIVSSQGADPSAGTESSLNYNYINFGAPHLLNDGAQIIFAGSGGGLETGRRYTVVKRDDNTIHLGAAFNGASVDVLTDTINFPYDHNFETGDLVYYHANGLTEVGADTTSGHLDTGTRYRVFVVDSDSIKLQEIGQATPSVTLGLQQMSGSTFTSFGHQLQNGMAVTYLVPDPIIFSSSFVDANVTINNGGTPNDPSDDTGSITQDFSNRIYVPNHGWSIGQAVVYRADGTPTIDVSPNPNLVSGHVYYVAGGGSAYGGSTPGFYSSSNYIRLARTHDEATGYFWDDDMDANTPDVWVAPSPMNLVFHDTAPYTDVTHSLRALNDEPIAGLVEGRVYFVRDVVLGVSFKLEDSPGSGAKTLFTPGSGGHHTFEVQGIDLQSAGGFGNHDLILDINSGLNSADSFDGVGGAKGVTGAPSGDNTVTASTTGVSGGLVTVSGSSSTATAEVTTNLDVGHDAVLSATDINLKTQSLLNVSANSDGGGGGGISIGAGTTNTTAKHHSKLSIGSDAELNATHDILVSADADTTATGLAVTGSYGLGAGADADSYVDLNYDVKTEVNGDLTADNLVTVESRAFANGDADAEVDAGGLGVGANTHARVRIGTSGEESALTRTDIKADADILGKNVVINAYVDKVRGRAYAETDVTAAGADCDALAQSYITSLNEVRLLDGAVITAEEMITVNSSYLETANSAISDADLDAVGGDTDSDADVNLNTRAKVEGHWEAVLTAADVAVNAKQEKLSSDSKAYRSGAWVDTGGKSESDGPKNARREIFWESHVILLGEPNPELEIDAAGNIVKLTNIDFRGVNYNKDVGDPLSAADPLNPQVVLDDIIYDHAGSLTFYANVAGDTQGVIWGNHGLVESQRTWDSVRIVNESEFDLVINHIDTSDGSAVVKIQVDDIRFSGDNDGNNNISLNPDVIGSTFEFDLNLFYPKTNVEIRNLTADDNDDSDIILLGGIENTIGSTTIENQRGNIRVDERDIVVEQGALPPAIFDEGLIRTNKLDVQASGDIGNQSASLASGVRSPLMVQLIRITHATEPAETPTLEEVYLNAQAGGDAVLDIALFDRSQDPALGSLDVTIDRITAKDDVDVVINDSKAGDDLSMIDGITVNTYDPPDLTTLQARSGGYWDHFSPDVLGPSYYDFI